jgi:hypothetical protein
MSATPEQHTPDAQRERTVRVRIRGKHVDEGEPKAVARWLREDPELKEAHVRAAVHAGAPDEAMGLAEDLLLYFGAMVGQKLTDAVFESLKSLYNHLRNRGNGPAEFDLVVRERVEARLTSRHYTRDELRRLAEKVAEAIEREIGPE